ncbi:NAD-dependent epimerase/dehydratase family protein [Rivibacter subsaxonicus]|uniref:Nucleoside-diphosphate-sugar epimerase n=1 Tax=Rivibacter subsaxonicus TaxID=457575 RepID=A0A4Q7VHF9_9BURK|nr:NAD-dependent epimerase/dehydratase family protein [Rivibacter subsaxonicus]RZT95348.1 nucleoside-diphosphate-sugar epimerase [Rivibacter subsaxonicus]
MNPSVSRPAAFRKPRLLVVGCGDVGLRVLQQLRGRYRVRALTSSAERAPVLRTAGALPLVGDLDRPQTLGRLGALASRVLHLAPPPGAGESDPRTAALLRALARGGVVQRIVYGSTSGVYGDAGGARFDETRATAPATARARRRVEAERQLRAFGRRHGVAVSLLRIPGIYAPGRAGGDPRERLARGTPLLAADDDVFTNHIHADDLARACLLALHRALPQRALHVSDDAELRMGEYFDLAADLAGLPRAPRVAREQAAALLSVTQLSFMGESRRLDNGRMKRELGLRLRYPTPAEGLAPLRPARPGREPSGSANRP